MSRHGIFVDSRCLMKSVLLLFLAFSLPLLTCGCFVTLNQAGPSGRGTEGNDFRSNIGAELGWQTINDKGRGVRVGSGFRTTSNEVFRDTTEGHIITPLFVDYIGNIGPSYEPVCYKRMGLKAVQAQAWHYTAGLGWNTMTLDGADGYNTYGSASLGIAYRVLFDKLDVSLGLKYHFYFGFDLGQTGGWDTGLTTAF